jgi:hypothetical protein
MLISEISLSRLAHLHDTDRLSRIVYPCFQPLQFPIFSNGLEWAGLYALCFLLYD